MIPPSYETASSGENKDKSCFVISLTQRVFSQDMLRPLFFFISPILIPNLTGGASFFSTRATFVSE